MEKEKIDNLDQLPDAGLSSSPPSSPSSWFSPPGSSSSSPAPPQPSSSSPHPPDHHQYQEGYGGGGKGEFYDDEADHSAQMITMI